MRKRIHDHFTDLRHQRETIEADLKALASDTGRAYDTDLLDELPELAGHLDELPEHLQAELFAAFDIQVLWNAPMNQATISDTTPGFVTDLLTRADDDPSSAASARTGTGQSETPVTSSNTVAGLTRLPILRKPTPIVKRQGSAGTWPERPVIEAASQAAPGARPGAAATRRR